MNQPTFDIIRTGVILAVLLVLGIWAASAFAVEVRGWDPTKPKPLAGQAPAWQYIPYGTKPVVRTAGIREESGRLMLILSHEVGTRNWNLKLKSRVPLRSIHVIKHKQGKYTLQLRCLVDDYDRKIAAMPGHAGRFCYFDGKTAGINIKATDLNYLKDGDEIKIVTRKYVIYFDLTGISKVIKKMQDGK